MNTIAKKLALVALCTTALTAASQPSHADVLFNISGISQNAFSYGPLPGADNVINFTGQPAANNTGSTVLDPNSAPSTWKGSGDPGTGFVNSAVTVTGLASGQNYSINWTYVGSESGDIIQFSAPGGAITTADDDRNNNCATCSAGPGRNVSTVPMGSTAYNNGDIPVFTVTDTNQIAGSVTNGSLNPAPANFFASLIFSYANLDGGNFVLTDRPTQFVVFGFNDNGFGDDNHDDFVGIMSLVPGQLENSTPIPGALPLFGSVLGGGLLFRRLRKRNKTA
jgi:hypothetical protein